MRTLRGLALLLLAAGAAAAAWARLRASRTRRAVDVYYEDGSLSSFDAESPEGINLLELAGEFRRAASV
jgi:hypothetical protein